MSADGYFEKQRREASRYGFAWGPMVVSRAAYVEGRGYAVMIETEHRSMQVYVSEKGQVIRSYPARKRAK